MHGYVGKILRVDLSTGKIGCMPTMDYVDGFIGGKGLAARIYWDEVPPDVGAFDQENRLIFMTGPMAGVHGFGFGGAGWKVCGKSPMRVPDQFSYANLSGSWGAHLKFSGYDGVVVQGKSDKPVYLFIHDGVAELRDASALWGRGAIETRNVLKGELGNSVRVVACGPAGENLVMFANLLADEDSSGSGGLGCVMGSKKLKAIAVTGNGKVSVADPAKLQQHTEYVRRVITAEPILLTHQLDLPPEFILPYPGVKMKKQVCYGCRGHGCMRAIYRADGKEGKFMCAAANFYRLPSYQYSGKWEWDAAFHANKLCDDYGVNIQVMSILVGWLGRCYNAGILTDKNTGIPVSKIGSLEFLETLLRKISLREGFGDVLAQGVVHAAGVVGGGSKELMTDDRVITEMALRTQEETTVDPRLFMEVALFFSMDTRVAKSHYGEILKLENGWLRWLNGAKDAYISSEVWRAIAKKFLGSELAADYSTYDGKALCAKMVHDREALNSSLVLCTYVWPVMTVKDSEDHVADPTIESKLFNAVTGREVSQEEFFKMGETIHNMERAIRVREGHRGRISDSLPEFYFTTPLQMNIFTIDCIVPGKDGEAISRKGMILDRAKFEQMKGEYYQLRGWDIATGLQTNKKLQELGLGEVAKDLEQRGLAV